jgi:hypothetical protein
MYKEVGQYVHPLMVSTDCDDAIIVMMMMAMGRVMIVLQVVMMMNVIEVDIIFGLTEDSLYFFAVFCSGDSVDIFACIHSNPTLEMRNN